MRAYSQDLRKRIIAAIREGKSRKEVARLFDVSPSTVKRYIRQWREQGNLLPKPIPGRPSKKLAPLRARLHAQLEAFPHATLEEHCEHWEAQEGIKVSIATMGRVIQFLTKKQKKRYWRQREKQSMEHQRKKEEKRTHDEENSGATHS
jgi:transposase